jgi:hypothetical protein
MLFDLRGRGRRRAIQVIYLGLAILMGGGLIFFGIGGNTNGGLFDAFSGSGGGSSNNASDAFNKRLENLEKRAQANPQDAAALAAIAKLHFQLATTGENYNQTQQAFTDKGKDELRQAATSWQRYLATNPSKPDDQTASLMVQALGSGGLERYPDAVEAMEIVIDSRKPTSALYSQLAILAAAAKQDRKSTLAEEKAVALAPKSQRSDLKAQIAAAKAQLTQPTPQSTPATPSG